MAGPRKQRPLPLELAPGLFMEETPRGAEGRWHDGLNVRWKDGLPEKMGGFTRYNVVDDASGLELLYKGRARSTHTWDSLDGQNWIAFGTHKKLYLVNNGRIYDITPIRRTATIIDGFATQVGSPVVTVTDPGHDAAEGDCVRFSGASAVGGITLSGEYEIETVLDLDRYTVRAASNAAATATGGGVVVAEYDIRAGLESDGILRGYGTGDYGEEAYGTARESSTYGAYGRVWSLDNWGEDLLASPNGDTLYVWDRTLGPGSRAKRVEGAPANIEFMMVGPDDRHVIAFGANTVSTGEQDRMFIRWCAGDNYEEWIPSDVNDAGSKRLDVGSRLITAIKTRRGILIWSDKGVYWLSVVGGLTVYTIDFVGYCQKIASRMAAAERNGVVYFMTEHDFYVYDGALTKLPCEIARYVFGSRTAPAMNRAMLGKAHACYLEEFDEIWWDFPGYGSEENSRVAIYNVAHRCWYVSDMARECRSGKNAAVGYPIGWRNGRLYLHENGVDVLDEEDNPAAMTAYLESFEGEIDPNGEYEMLVNAQIPDFKALSGSVQIRLFAREYPGAPRRQTELAAVSSTTERTHLRIRGRQIGLRVESTALGDDWRMGTWRLIAGPIGAR